MFELLIANSGQQAYYGYAAPPDKLYSSLERQYKTATSFWFNLPTRSARNAEPATLFVDTMNTEPRTTTWMQSYVVS